MQRNSQIVQAYRLLSARHGSVVHDLAVLASQYCSLQRELFEAQTDAVAYEAVVRDYTQFLASRDSLAAQKSNVSPRIELLTAKVAELERERTDMRRALVSASELLIASRQQCDSGRVLGSEF